jgi:hypothetical protein
LLKRSKPAIRGVACKIFIGTPRIILGRGGFLKADDSRKHTNDEQKNPHGKLQISGSQTTDSDPNILFPHSRRAAAPEVG